MNGNGREGIHGRSVRFSAVLWQVYSIGSVIESDVSLFKLGSYM